MIPTDWYQWPTHKYAPEMIAEMQRLWEHEPDVSAVEIGERFGVTKNVVIGQAARRNWLPRGGGRKTTTLSQRLDALHSSMDALLIETRPFVEDREKLILADQELFGVAA